VKLTLIGGEEFADGFEAVHESVISPIANGRSNGIFIPTCAAHDGIDVVKRWCTLAQQRLLPYARAVEAPFIIDEASASDPANVALIQHADWIYLGGGHPETGMRIWRGTPVLDAIVRAAQSGIPIIGASAGAMVQCATSIIVGSAFASRFGAGQGQNQAAAAYIPCLGFIPVTLCIPHWNKPWARAWANLLPEGHTLIGIDEQTAMSTEDSTLDSWVVLGKGHITIDSGFSPARVYGEGDRFSIIQR
jgi:cyanophycinase-like exopeptidase